MVGEVVGGEVVGGEVVGGGVAARVAPAGGVADPGAVCDVVGSGAVHPTPSARAHTPAAHRTSHRLDIGDQSDVCRGAPQRRCVGTDSVTIPASPLSRTANR